MLPKTHPLIETITKPLAKNAEQRLSAISLLQENLNAEDDATPRLVEQFAKIDSSRKNQTLRAGAIIAAAIVLLFSILSQKPLIDLFTGINNSGLFGLSLPQSKLPPGLSQKEKLLLGDPSQTKLTQKTLLWKSEPNNPAYYAQYVAAYHDENKALPPDYFETILKIAPENSFFLYYAAAQIGGESIEKKDRIGKPSAPRTVDGVKLRDRYFEREIAIQDQEKFHQALSLINKASKLQQFDTYEDQQLTAISPLLPRTDFSDYVKYQPFTWASGSQLIALRKVADILDAQGQQLSIQGKKMEFLRHVEIRERFLKHFSSDQNSSLLKELIYLVNASTYATYLHGSSSRLGLDDLAQKFKTQVDGFQSRSDQRSLSRAAAQKHPAEVHGSVFTSLSLPSISGLAINPPAIDPERFKPLRLVDHEVASKLGILTVAALIAISAIAIFAFQFIYPPQIRTPSQRLASLLQIKDWLIIVTGSAILPIVVFLTINRLTPLGGREYGIQYFVGLFPSIHLISLLFYLLLMPAILIRWRLSKTLTPFGIDFRPSKISIAILVLVFIWALTAYPLLLKTGTETWALLTIASIPALWIAWIFLTLLLSLISKSNARVPHAATASLLIPCYAAGIICLCATIPVFSQSERKWIKEDQLMTIDPTAEDLGVYEFKVAKAVQKEINQILDLEN